MSWDGKYVNERVYHTFNVGDEVYSEKRYRALSRDKGYIVLKCYKPSGFIDTYKGIVIDIKTDQGHISRYATSYFKLTDKQIRINKLKRILK